MTKTKIALLDFDDVLFNTSDFSEASRKIFINSGVSEKEHDEFYQQMREDFKVKDRAYHRDEHVALFIERFPEFSSPFWNMRRIGTSANKIDVIIDGMETIGSAERSSNVGEMRERFHSISGGGYAALLYKKFGKRRVIRELEEFLSLTFFPRCGGGIGMTRLMKACTLGE